VELFDLHLSVSATESSCGV